MDAYVVTLSSKSLKHDEHPTKISQIKSIRAVLGFGLRDAKMLMETMSGAFPKPVDPQPVSFVMNEVEFIRVQQEVVLGCGHGNLYQDSYEKLTEQFVKDNPDMVVRPSRGFSSRVNSEMPLSQMWDIVHSVGSIEAFTEQTTLDALGDDDIKRAFSLYEIETRTSHPDSDQRERSRVKLLESLIEFIIYQRKFNK